MRLRSLLLALLSAAMLTVVVGCGSPPKYNVPVDSPFLPWEPSAEVADNDKGGEDDPEIPEGTGDDDDDDDDGAAPAPAAPAPTGK